MFVNVILHQQVPVFCEKDAKFRTRELRWFLQRDPGVTDCRCWRGIKSRLMSEPHRPDDTSANSPLNTPATAKNNEMFANKPPESGGIPVMAWGVAGLAVLVVVVVLVLAGRHKASAPTTLQPPAAYAAGLPLSQLAMSESTSLSCGKSTFIDGHVKNTCRQTVSGITVQLVFRNDEAMPPKIAPVPLSLVRTREPYVDTQSVSAAPLKPGDERDFRLIFESIPANWNQQMPEIRIIQVETK